MDGVTFEGTKESERENIYILYRQKNRQAGRQTERGRAWRKAAMRCVPGPSRPSLSSVSDLSLFPVL